MYGRRVINDDSHAMAQMDRTCLSRYFKLSRSFIKNKTPLTVSLNLGGKEMKNKNTLLYGYNITNTYFVRLLLLFLIFFFNFKFLI